MNHEHSFPRESDNVGWDDERDVLIVERNCTCRVRTNPGPVSGGFGGPGGHSEEPCDAVKKTAYEVYSVTDNHDNHSLDCSSVVVKEGGYVSDNSKHISELDEMPKWVESIIDTVRGRARQNTHIAHMTRLIGSQFSVLIARSNGEYNITFDKVDEQIIE